MMPYWGIFPFWLRFVDLHWFAWSSPFMRYMSRWWSVFILQWFPSGAFLESFSQAHTFLYYRDSVMELFQAHNLPCHHFSGVHVKSLIHLHWVILELSGLTRCPWGIFPSFSCGCDCFLTDLLQSSLLEWGIFICITGHSFSDFGLDEPPNEHDLLGFDYLAIHGFSVDFWVEVAIVTPTDYSLETSYWIIHLR